MHKVFVLLKQAIETIILEYTGHLPGAPNPSEIVAVAIQILAAPSYSPLQHSDYSLRFSSQGLRRDWWHATERGEAAFSIVSYLDDHPRWAFNSGDYALSCARVLDKF